MAGEFSDPGLVNLLHQIPADRSSVALVFINDYAAIREAFSIELPSEKASSEEIRAYREQLSTFPGAEPAFQRSNGVHSNPVELALRDEEARITLGFTALEIDREAWTPIFSVLQGEFAREAVEEALKRDERLGKYLSQKEFRGFEYFLWPGAIAQTPLSGRDRGLAVTPHYIYLTNRESERTIDFGLTLEGRSPSLADFQPFLELTETMSDLGALGFCLSTDVYSEQSFGELWRGAYGAAAVDQLLAQRLLIPYQAFAVGWGMSHETPQVYLITVQTTPADAAENVARIRLRVEEGISLYDDRPWRDVFTIDDIHADGTVVIAKLNVSRADARIWSNIVGNLDSLWAAE